MPPITYVARRPGPFSVLVQAAEIGGFRLEPESPVRVLDRYYDTDDGELLRRGLGLRVREEGGRVGASLRTLGESAEASAEVDLEGPVGDAPLHLPPSVVADTVRAAIGEDALRPLLTLRQYRTPRTAFDGPIPVGRLSFDVVVYEVPGAREVSNEVEIISASGADLLAQLGPVFEARGLEPVEQSAFERGILRMRRTLAEPALLLPEERRQLEEVVAFGDDPSLRRRAHVLLLDARGFRPDTIASQTGLSMARVQFWRERFREVRLGVLDPDPAPPRRASLATSTPPSVPSSGAPGAPLPSGGAPAEATAPLPGGSEGDGLAGRDLEDPTQALDMADLLDLFSPTLPDTPFFDGHTGADEEAGLDAPEVPRSVPTPDRLSVSSPPRNPYPVVLGPVQVTPAGSRRTEEDPFSEVDLSRLRRAARTGAAASPRPAPAAEEVRGRETAPGLVRPKLDGDTPLLAAAEAMLAYAVAVFDEQAARFLDTQAPSAARRLLVAAHGLRMTVETFGDVLPAAAGDRLVAALRPLAVDLDEALETARVALAEGGRADLVRQATATLGTAAERLRGGREPWGARARRLVERLAAQSAAGARRSDDAPLADDFVGAPGDAPSPTRLRHMLGSAVWSRFEAIRALEDDLRAPSPALASHFAVALSGLQFVLSLVEPSGGRAVGELSEALGAAEAAAVELRQRHASGHADALEDLADLWAEVTSLPFKKRVAGVVATV